MAVSLENFVKQLEDSGILAGDTLKDYIPPKASPKDATDLARELVRQKKLTKFQAEEVSKGKGKSLVLGNYVLMEKIGAGGMGQVFKARHRRMDRFVAVKLLPTAMTKDKAAIARFEREVKAAAKLRHPNIVAADDADCANGVHFLVMEMVEGQDLSALVKKNGPFSIEEAVDYVLQAAKGLEFAHKKGVVHRDIKPANLLLDNEGVVKILDMGLARLNGDDDGSPQADLTNTGTIMGTVDYMAPEQALDTKTADARADIYALGCSLYYLLTGKSTYDGDTLMKRLLAHREQHIPSLRAARPEVSDPLVAVFQKMVAKKIEDRYQTMTELLVDLETCCGRNEQTVALQEPMASSTAAGTTDLFKELLTIPSPPPIQRKKVTQPLMGFNGKDKKSLLLIGGGLLGVLILLAGLVVTLKTKDGTLIVTVSEPDADVQVQNEEGKVEITRKGAKGPITISVDPGKHRLKVTKDGFTVFGQDFEIEAGEKQPITAKLVPLEGKPAMVGAKPAPVPAGTKPPVVAGAKKPLAFETPGFDQWVKEVAAMPAEQQVEAVSKKLVELNPGFDGKVTPTIEGGVVTGLNFLTDNVTDISPVRALVGLKGLVCGGSEPGKGKLADLMPLKGVRLADLSFFNTQVGDISPLRGMPFTKLYCNATPVADLSPLQGMPLTELGCNTTNVSDLSPLQGMKLTSLTCNLTRVSDLSPLKGMQLTVFTCAGCPVADLSPLNGMSVTFLVTNGSMVTDLSPIKNMPLTVLNFDFKPFRDTELFRSIKTLETINNKPTAEFWKEVEEQK
jgi:serine/threonine protein kinase